MNYKKICLAVCFLLPGIWVLAQKDPSTKRHLFMALGSSFHRLQDPAVSPLTYRGDPFMIQLGYKKQKPNTISEISLTMDLGKLSSRNATEVRPMASQFYQIDLQYLLMKKLSDPTKPIQWFIGGSYRWHNSIRLTPQNDTGFISFLIANSLRAAVQAQKRQSLFGREATLFWKGSVPLLSHVIRPSYLNIYNYLDPENNWLEERLKDSRFSTLNRFPGLESEFGLIYPMAGGNTFSLSYLWAFQHYAGERRVNATRNVLAARLSLRF